MKIKKMMLSLSLVGFSLLTMVATTFAWVGITTNSTFDEFSIKLKTENDIGSYGVQLSLDGLPNTFVDSIDSISIRRQILKNLGYDSSIIDNASEDRINVMFSQYKMGQCTPKKTTAYPNIFSSNNVQTFENVIDGLYTTRFIYFDVYASLYVTNSTIKPDAGTSNISLFLRESILSSNDIGTCELLNTYKYPTSSISIGNKIYNSPFANKTLQGKVKVNPASAARVCIQKFEPIDLYTSGETDFVDYTIYQYDDSLPVYDNLNDIYSFGGILPTEHNMAHQQYLLSHPGVDVPDVPQWQVDRGDVTYSDSGNIGRIVDESDGLTVGKKIKFRIYFWFEGWDSDCFEVIDKMNVNVNLSFSNKAPYDV